MKAPLESNILPSIIVGLKCLLCNQSVFAEIDPSPVWRNHFAVKEHELEEDCDGDGMITRIEGFFGTDPFDASSIVAPSIRLGKQTSAIVWRAPAGSHQRVQISRDLRFWENLGVPVAGADGELSVSLDESGTYFVRIVVAPAPDVDGDGLDSLEEAILGTDPVNSDSDGDGYDDGIEALNIGTDPVSDEDPVVSKQGRSTLSPGSVGYAIAGDGTLRTWGITSEESSEHDSITNTVPFGSGDGWASISGDHLALKWDGSLWAWGPNHFGQLGDGTNESRDEPVRIGIGRWKMVSDGGVSSHAIAGDGTLWAWGTNDNGQLGDGTTENRNVPTQIGTDTDWKQVSAAINHVLAIKTDGSLWSWGNNERGQLGTANVKSQTRPVRISLGGWDNIQAGWMFSLGQKMDGTYWVWGSNENGQLGIGSDLDSPVPVMLSDAWESIDVDGTSSHAAGIRSDGSLWAWGWNSRGQLGQNTNGRSNLPVRVGTSNDWTQVKCGNSVTFAANNQGMIFEFGYVGYEESWRRTNGSWRNRPIRIGQDQDWAAVSAGSEHSVALKTDGSIWTWGSLWLGRKESALRIYNIAPTLRETVEPVVYLDSRMQFTASVTTNGKMLIWGGDDEPVHQFGNDVDWRAVALQSGSAYGLKVDGSLWTWSIRYLKDPSPVPLLQPVPERVGDDSDWAQIATGNHHVLGLKNDRSLWIWGGNNSDYILGDGTLRSSSVPVQRETDRDWASVFAADVGSMAIKQNGELWRWGDNQFDQLGEHTIFDINTPQLLTEPNGWITVAPGPKHSAAIREDGSLWTWGFNRTGQLGDSTNEHRDSPVQIGKATRWKAVAVGNSHTIAIQKDGSLWSWGDNSKAQLGDGWINRFQGHDWQWLRGE
ncbi:MAG: hypothetical protein R3F19_26215 [Verrucomicrobiales bacterium]